MCDDFYCREWKMESVEVDLEFTSGGIVKKKGRHMEIREILKQVKTGEMSVKEAEQYLRREPFEEMGYAKLDVHRKLRSGFAEVVFINTDGKASKFLINNKNFESYLKVVKFDKETGQTDPIRGCSIGWRFYDSDNHRVTMQYTYHSSDINSYLLHQQRGIFNHT